MNNYQHQHRYEESKAAIKNLYDPVLYMLKRQNRRAAFGAGGGADDANTKEGAKLHRDGVFLMHVEGDEFYDHLLHYDENDRLVYYVCLHRKTGKAEGWELEWDENQVLLDRFNYELLHEEEEQFEDSPDAPHEGYGQEIDDDL